MSNSNFVYKKMMENWADIEKEIEKEEAHLVYFDHKNKEDARALATEYVHNKYKDLVTRLSAEGGRGGSGGKRRN